MKRVFISFRSENKKQVDGMRLLAANLNFDIEFYDKSVRNPFEHVFADCRRTGKARSFTAKPGSIWGIPG